MCNQGKNNRKQLLSVSCFCKHPVTIKFLSINNVMLDSCSGHTQQRIWSKEAVSRRGLWAGKCDVPGSEQVQRDLKGAKHAQVHGALFSAQ